MSPSHEPDDEGYFDLNDDDEQARRVLSLAVEFMNARGPIGDSTIRKYYPDLSKESRSRAFHRDRARLALCGIVVERFTSPDGEVLWRVDEQRSFAEGSQLTEREALMLDIACLPLVNDPEFTFRDELRIALAKIDRAFSGSTATRLAVSKARDDRDLATLRSCMIEGHAATITYTRVDGEMSTRLVAPFGFFGLRGKLYMVAPRVDASGAPEPDSMRVYLIDRVRSAKAQKDISFEVPADFDVEDWRRLPFQIGPKALTCEFFVPSSMVNEVRRTSLGRGEFYVGERGTMWRVDAASARDAASWAIAHGIEPQSPEELVFAWRTILEGVVRNG